MFSRPPASRANLRIRLCPFDVALAAAAPLAALYLRNVSLASYGDWIVAGSYSLVSLIFSLVAFQIVGIGNAIPRYMSMTDLLDVAKAVLGGQLMTALALFSVTRLDGIPRSVPAIQALVLGSGLIAYRILGSLTERHRGRTDRPRNAVTANVILIGLNDFSVLVLKFLRARTPERWRVIALLDEESRWIGRSVGGVQVFGPPADLETVIEEFATHGVPTHRIVVGGKAGELSKAALAQIERVCTRRDLDLLFAPDLFAVGSGKRTLYGAEREVHHRSSSPILPDGPRSAYSCLKRIFDVITAAILILWLLPLLTLAVFMVLFDVGSPVLFWQQRVGRGGRELRIYKLRTLRPPFDRKGQRIPPEQRLSWIGRLLRRLRLDELPQLLNVLIGEMSLIGPRPLLAQDQPPDSAMRLTVRPGITGWAQVNGGAKLSASEKGALDLWYVCNASLWLDLRIIGMTLVSLLRGDRRSEAALARARSVQAQRVAAREPDLDMRSLRPAVALRFPAPAIADDDREPAAIRSR